MTKLQEPNVTSNKHLHHDRAVSPSGGMGLVGPLNPTQGQPVQGVGRGCRRRINLFVVTLC